MLRELPSTLCRATLAAILLVPLLAEADPSPSPAAGNPANAAGAKRAEPIGMVGFTRESAEDFRTSKAAPAPVVVAATVHKSAAPGRNARLRQKRPLDRSEAAGLAAAKKEKANLWPRFLRGRWAGSMENIHQWWNRHFDRRHFPYPDNPRPT